MLPSRLGPGLDRIPARLQSLVRYASVSAIATTVGLIALALLVDAGHWPPVWANVVATALGTIPSFELNRRWVWRRDGHRSMLREVVPFCGLCLVELVASSEAVRATAAWTLHSGWGNGTQTLADLAANVATYGGLWIVQYLFLDRVLFARRRRVALSETAPPDTAPPDCADPNTQRTLHASSAPVQEPAAGLSQ